MREHKVAASHRIGGVILIILSSFLCLLIIPMFALGESELIFPALFGFVCMLFGISLYRGKFMRFEQDKKRKGIYLTHVSMVDGMEGREFEHFCADLLRRNGFADVSVTRGSGDQGVDVLATKGGIKYAIQCKNYASPLSNTPVQEVSAGKIFYNCHVGVVLTNSTFTPGAISLANATGVLLWDRSTLAELMRNE